MKTQVRLGNKQSASIFLIIALAFLVSFPRTSRAAEEAKLHMAGGVTAGAMIYKFSKEKGFYKQEGLELVSIETGLVQGIQGLIAGSLDFSQILGQGASAILRGAPLKIVMVFDNRPLWWIYGGKNVRSLQDLKGGKQVGTATFGSAVDQMTREVFLPKYGIEPGRDVILRPIEPPPNRLTALMAGAVDAAVLTLMEHTVAKKNGLNELFFYGEQLEFVTAGVVVSDQTVSQRPDFVRRFLRGTLRGFHWWKSNEKEVVKEMVRLLKVSEDESVTIYKVAVRAASSDGTISDALQERMIGFQKKALKVESDIDPQKVYDFSFLRSLNKEIGNRSGP